MLFNYREKAIECQQNAARCYTNARMNYNLGFHADAVYYQNSAATYYKFAEYWLDKSMNRV